MKSKPDARIASLIALGAAFFGFYLFAVFSPGAFLSADTALFKALNGHHAPLFDRLFWVVSLIGSAKISVPIFTAIVLLWAPRPKRAALIAIAAAALLFNAFVDEGIKRDVDRPRPAEFFSAETPPHTFGRIPVGHSFPSGHTNNIFAVATLLVLFFGKKYGPVFLFAAAVAYSRVYLGAHFPSDTLAGACLGIFIALAVWSAARKRCL